MTERWTKGPTTEQAMEAVETWLGERLTRGALFRKVPGGQVFRRAEPTVEPTFEYHHFEDAIGVTATWKGEDLGIRLSDWSTKWTHPDEKERFLVREDLSVELWTKPEW